MGGETFRPYLYGHSCEVYTDHEALKSLLNTPHPSGKLARWGMAIQELDLQILHRSGKHNSNADALSRCPLTRTEVSETSSPEGVVAAVSSGEDDRLPALQRQDPELALVIEYLESGVLPDDEHLASTDSITVCGAEPSPVPSGGRLDSTRNPSFSITREALQGGSRRPVWGASR